MGFTPLNEWLREMMEKQYEREEGFFCIIPALVLQNQKLSDGAKILYGEISALVNKYGYCYATNKHLAERLNKTERTIRNLIRELKNAKLIKVEVEKNKEGTRRKIWISFAK
jgi:predicted HTH transcriptional regulator